MAVRGNDLVLCGCEAFHGGRENLVWRTVSGILGIEMAVRRYLREAIVSLILEMIEFCDVRLRSCL